MLTDKLFRILRRFAGLPRKIERIQEALGRIEMRQIVDGEKGLSQSEFRAFSQWGEDGIIQYLVSKVPIERRIFVEFGVENYTEANTRFLLTNNYWSGLVMDGSSENIAYIRKDSIYWACNLKAVAAFITQDNINGLLLTNGVSGDIGLLSIDIDGNDYWVWKAIDSMSPRIVVCEYNSHFGPVASVTTPYDPGFVRDLAHSSKIYYGASITALSDLASAKGYSLVGSNSAGNNVFFVRDDVLGTLPVLTPSAAYRRGQFREYHDQDGHLTFDDFDARIRKIAHLDVYDLKIQQIRKLADVPDVF